MTLRDECHTHGMKAHLAEEERGRWEKLYETERLASDGWFTKWTAANIQSVDTEALAERRGEALDAYDQFAGWVAADDHDGLEQRPKELLTRARELSQVARNLADDQGEGEAQNKKREDE